jgi:hypothetical protein
MQPHKDCINGHVVIDDFTSAECPNMRVRRQADLIRSHLTPELATVKPVKSSPLYVPKTVDHTGKNLFIQGIPWSVFRGHLKYIVMWKVLTGQPLTYKVVDDQRLKEVFLGSEAYKSRPASVREQRETNNAIDDLVAESFDLVIIRLGLLGHKNSAAANVLREALMLRTERYNKPTWLFLSSDSEIHWEHSRDPNVESYVGARFSSITLKSASKNEAYGDTGIIVDGDEEAPELEEKMHVPVEHLGSASDEAPMRETVEEEAQPPPQAPSPQGDDDFGLGGAYSGGGKKNYKKGRRS